MRPFLPHGGAFEERRPSRCERAVVAPHAPAEVARGAMRHAACVRPRQKRRDGGWRAPHLARCHGQRAGRTWGRGRHPAHRHRAGRGAGDGVLSSRSTLSRRDLPPPASGGPFRAGPAGKRPFAGAGRGRFVPESRIITVQCAERSPARSDPASAISRVPRWFAVDQWNITRGGHTRRAAAGGGSRPAAFVTHL